MLTAHVSPQSAGDSRPPLRPTDPPQIATGVILATSYSAKDGSQVLSSGAAAGALVCICLFIAGFAWSW